MRCFLGVDSGGTKTKAVVTSVDGITLGYALAGSTDIVNAGRKNAVLEICGCVNTAMEMANVRIGDIEFSCFAMSGYGDVVSAYEDINEVVDSVVSGSRLIINDVRAALEGAFPLTAGAIVLAGTGAMCMAKNESGEIFRTDGWGEHIGDIGSAYYIGQMGLREAFKSYDGRSTEGELLRKAREYSSENAGNVCDADIKNIIDSCKGKNIRAYIAGFGKKVDEAAESGDATAMGILEDAAGELFASLKAVVRKSGIKSGDKKIKVSLTGSVFNSEIVKSRLIERISGEGFEYVAPVLSPEYGAVIIAASCVLDEGGLRVFLSNLVENNCDR